MIQTEAKEGYPRLANYFLKGEISDKEAEELAKWDVLVLGMEAPFLNPGLIRILKKKNPKIKILAYVSSEEIPLKAKDLSKENPWFKLYKQVEDKNWWLRDDKARALSIWLGTRLINVASDWNTYLPEFMHQEVMASGLWDGIFYDVIFDRISWVNNGEIDINNDGIKDPAYLIDSEWQKGMIKLLSYSRLLEGPGKIIVGNGATNYYDRFLNGRMFENFSAKDWAEKMKDYQNFRNGYQPFLAIINSNTENKGGWDNFSKLRFGLGSALMGDGYYSFDHGDQDHSQLWWYDEYGVGLGRPKTEGFNIFEKNNKEIRESVWRRDFENGLVLVNATSEEKTVDLEGEYEKIKGVQDIKINSGAIVTKVSLAGKDGLVLLRPIDKIIGSVFTNGSFARVFNEQGRNTRNGFFAYEKNFPGGKDIVIKDLDGDEEKEMVVAGKNLVEIYGLSSGIPKLKTSFHLHGSNYDKNINIAVGDLEGDKKMEIVTGTGQSGEPQVRIFNYQGKLLNPGFLAYDKNFRGGVNITVGDLDGDGKAEIITGAGFSGGPHVRIFNFQGKLINPGFFAYSKNFRGGVNVGVGDIDGDGRLEIIAGAGYGGGPHIRIFNSQGKLIHPGFFAFNPQSRNGVKVVINDLDDDGRAEIIGMSTGVFTTALSSPPPLILRKNVGVGW